MGRENRTSDPAGDGGAAPERTPKMRTPPGGVKANIRVVFGAAPRQPDATSPHARAPRRCVAPPPVSRSPRKLLDRAADALEEFEEVLRRFPEADAQVRAALTDAGLDRITRTRAELRAAAARLRDATGAAAPDDRS